MKKFIFVLTLLVIILPMRAEQKVGEYTNSYFKKSFDIEAAEKNRADIIPVCSYAAKILN